MEEIVDWLPYIDTIPQESRLEIENLVEEEYKKLDIETIHPDVESLIGGEITKRFGHEKPIERNDKRAAEDESASQAKRLKGVDKERYDLEKCETNEQCAILEAYLGHQECVLRELLPRTLAPQWAMNNEYMSSVRAQLEDIIEVQKTQLRDLDAHRESLQRQEERELKYLEQQWRDTLLHLSLIHI